MSFFFFNAEVHVSVLGINPVALDGGIILKNSMEKIVSML